MKSKLLKHIDELEQKFITKLTSIKEKNETKIKKEKDELSRLVSCLKDEKQELEFHKNHSEFCQCLCPVLLYLCLLYFH
jgi:superoxide dismutase